MAEGMKLKVEGKWRERVESIAVREGQRPDSLGRRCRHRLNDGPACVTADQDSVVQLHCVKEAEDHLSEALE